MPELPEVETTRRGLEPHVVNQVIDKIIIRAPKLRWPIPKSIAKDLPGKKVLSIERRAKYLLVNFASGTLIMHLGMSGWVIYMQVKHCLQRVSIRYVR